jgi:hypothetical protein
MGDSLIGGGTVVGKSLISGATATSAAKPKKKGKSVGGFFGNLAGDVKDTALGLPAGIKMTVEHPVRTAKAVGAAYVYQYTPLYHQIGAQLHGDVKSAEKWRTIADERLYQHPLGPLTDLLTVASGGATAMTKVGLAESTAGKTIGIAGPSGKVVEKAISIKPVRGYTQAYGNAAADKFPATTPVVGSASRAGREIGAQARRKARANQQAAAGLKRATSKLSKDEQVASFLLTTLPHPADVARYLKQLSDSGDPAQLATIKVITRPAVRKLYDDPSPRMLRADAEIVKVGAKQEQILGSLLSDESKQVRPWLHTLIARGAKMEDGNLVPAEGFASVPEMIASAKTDLAVAGRPEPKYLPDVQAVTKDKIRYGGSGGGVQRMPGETKQNQAILFQSGRLVQDPSVLSQSYLHSVKYAHYTDLHNRLTDHARVLPAASTLPKGWEYLRRPAKPFKATLDDTTQTVGKSAERIPRSVQTRADLEEWAAQHLDKADVENFLTERDGGFTTANHAEAATDKGNYLIVPKRFANQVKGEFIRSNDFAHWMNRYPVRVWRALVLNLRPAWLVNNVVGNTLMYAMHNTSPQGATALLDSFKRMFPHQADEFDRIMEQRFSGQIGGTFIGTQRPSGVLPGLAGKVEKVVDTLANFDRAYEQALRRAAVKKQLATHPSIRAVTKGLRDDVERWKTADAALAKNPAIAVQIEDKVNAILGNFSHMSGVERNVLRTLFPFWAWYRAITGVMVKLPLEQPLKVSILARLGALGVDETMADLGVAREDVPDFIRGLIPVGKMGADRRVPVITTAWNPYQTGPALVEFATAIATMDRARIVNSLPGLNPVFQQALSGRDYGLGIFNLPVGFVDSLPETQLIKDALGRQYKGAPGKPTVYDKNFPADAKRFVGVPKARLSVQAAKNRQQRLKSGR